jgi:SpoVK/Ycf46/Vps4 family AAA+-type ATPase
MIKPIEHEIELLIRARYSIIYIESFEENRVEESLYKIAERRKKKLYCWSIERGIYEYGVPMYSKKAIDERTKDPAAALQQVVEIVEPSIFAFKDFHPFMNDPGIVRKLRELSFYLKGTYKTIVLISPQLKIPIELDKEITHIVYPAPTADDLRELLDKIIREVKERSNVSITIEEGVKDRLIEAALGLTLAEAENVFAKALVIDTKLGESDIPVILAEKEQIIRKSGILEFYSADESFAEIGGLQILKEWLLKRQLAFSAKAKEFGLPAPRGILLIGVQGCGKSLTAKAVSGLWKLPLLRLDVGKLFSSYIGSTEENMRRAIRVAESIAPAILWIDEIEKSFAGVQSSAFSDAGTAARVFGTFITWLQEKTLPVFVIATANSIEQLPPELLRKGRFDEIFFVDLPSTFERKQIFAIHLKKRKRNPEDFDLDRLARESEGFSGAEIEQAIISAMFDVFAKKAPLTTEDILESLKETMPLSITMRENIESLRNWARGRARNASYPEDEIRSYEKGIGIEIK